MIATDLQPYSIVTDNSFRNFVKCLEPRYNLPTRAALSSKIIPALYEETKAKIVDTLNNSGIKSLAVTTDGWTSNTNDSYVSFTAHYLDNSFTVYNQCLRVQFFPETHTANHLAVAIEECVSEWLHDYKDNVIFVITDNARNIVAALKQLPSFRHLTCFGHTLQLTIINAAKAYPDLNNLATKARKIVSYFHHSSQATHRLNVAQVQLKLTEHKLKMEVSTRWNSRFYMLQRLVEQKDAVMLALSSIETVENFTPHEWRTAAEYCNTLQPFEEATILMSGCRYPTLSMVIPLLNILYKKLQDRPDAAGSVLNDFRRSITDELKSRFPDHETNLNYSCASLVDPRFKRFAFSNEVALTKAVTEVAQIMEMNLCEQETTNISVQGSQREQSEAQTSAQSTSTSQPQPSLWNTFRDMVAEQLTTSNAGVLSFKERAERELETFLNDPIIAPEDNAFEWWSNNAVRFPLVATVARTFLAVPGTSVPSEQLFSTAGQVITERRNRLKPEHAEQLVFLCKNLRK